ncbi:secondary thiamine-phosphate synthase enzyme YjbQ [Algicola sagamiensis]|uniref:secondary thiamine-phosphate synthase enzyme YjbQ n=1 Tax=Algicola sagamiensis TaxID=163869 RepID=UPI0003723DF0|nr:secondary thiamine-phosphate synthase enzyme YjbQ [Algicola sagamiensis]
MFFQKPIQLKARARGFHLITDEVIAAVPELKEFSIGLAHIFIQHTSASLTINENADPTVRADMESHMTRSVPEDIFLYTHDYEGEDDMPAHIKASLLGNSVTVPVTQGRLNLGTWQGIYLGEHRNHGGPRRIVVTIQGEGYYTTPEHQ